MVSSDLFGGSFERVVLGEEFGDARDGRSLVFPSLIVGCGGSGVKVGRATKERVRRFLNVNLDARDERELRAPDVVQFLSMDTLPWSPDHKPLARSEYLEMGGFNAGRVVQAMRHSQMRNKQNSADPIVYDEVARWWNNDINPGLIHQGARQRRPIGRLAFFYGFRAFKAAFEAKRQKLLQIESIQRTEEAGRHVQGRTRLPRIYIVSSLCGGTGSGFFLDVALWARRVFHENAHIVGVLAMPSVFTQELPTDIQRRRVQANAYAALQELEFYQNRAQLDPSVVLKYPGEPQIPMETIGRPFNRIYLVERTNQGLFDTAMEALSSQDDTWALIAQQILIEIGTRVGSRLWELDVNLPDERLKEVRGAGRGFLSYSSFANTTLVLPVQKLRGLAAASTARAAVERTLDGYDVGDTTRTFDENGQRRHELEQAADGLLTEVNTLVERQDDPTSARQALRVAIAQTRNLAEASFLTRRLLDQERGLPSRVQRLQQQIGGDGGRGGAGGMLVPTHAVLSRLRRLPLLGIPFAPLYRMADDARRRRQGAGAGVARRGAVQRVVANLNAIEQALRNLSIGLDERHQQLSTLLVELEKEERAILAGSEAAWRVGERVEAEHLFEMYTELLTRGEIQRVLESEGYAAPAGTSGRPSPLPSKARSIVDSRVLLERALAIEEQRNEADVPVLRLRDDVAFRYPQLGIVEMQRLAERQVAADFDEMQILDLLAKYAPPDRAPRQLELAFERCRPFWRFEAETGFGRENLDPIQLVGLSFDPPDHGRANGRDVGQLRDMNRERWRRLLADFEQYEPVETGDRLRLYASVVVHGLPAEFIEGIDQYRHYAEDFGDELHVMPKPPGGRWPDLAPEDLWRSDEGGWTPDDGPRRPDGPQPSGGRPDFAV